MHVLVFFFLSRQCELTVRKMTIMISIFLKSIGCSLVHPLLVTSTVSVLLSHLTICKACTYTVVYTCWIHGHVVTCPSSDYQIPIAIHFLNFAMVLYGEGDDGYDTWRIAHHLHKNRTFIIIPSESAFPSCIMKKSSDDSKYMNKVKTAD